jgi:hypothetical protein
MGLKKGQTNNRRGRPKGTPNKVSTGVKMQLREFFDEHWQEMPKVWRQLTAKDKVIFITAILPYLEAKLASVEMSGEINFTGMSEAEIDAIAIKLYNHEKNGSK